MTIRLVGELPHLFLFRCSTRDHDAQGGMVHCHSRDGISFDRSSSRYTPSVHDRDPLRESPRPDDIEAVRQFLLDLATEGFLDEAEFWAGLDADRGVPGVP